MLRFFAAFFFAMPLMLPLRAMLPFRFRRRFSRSPLSRRWLMRFADAASPHFADAIRFRFAAAAGMSIFMLHDYEHTL